MKKYICLISLLLSALPANSQQNLFIVEDSVTGLMGCMNLSKEVVIPYQYEEITDVGEGYYVFVKNSKVGIFDSFVHIRVPNLYGYGVRIDTKNEVLYAPKDGKYGLVDFNNNVLIPFQYDDIYNEKKKMY